MFSKSTLCETYLSIVWLILISNSINTLGQNPDSNSSLNINDETAFSVTAPKLLGIFADENTNILEENVDNSSDKAKIDGLMKNGKRIPMERTDEMSVRVSHNSTQTSLELTNDSMEKRIDTDIETTTNITRRRSKCGKWDSKNSRVDLDHQVDCVIGSDLDPFQQMSFAQFSSNTAIDADTPKIIYMHIPDEGEDEMNKTSYIAMMVEVWSKPGGQVLIIDEGSEQQLLSYNNLDKIDQWGNNHANGKDGEVEYESFASDSNKVRVEINFPTMENLVIIPIYSDDTTDGQRIGTFVSTDSFNMTIKYFEIGFTRNDYIILDPTAKSPTNQSNTDGIEAQYIPNSVVTYILNSPDFEEPPNQNPKIVVIGVNITLEYLNIDIDKGDFLLIGPGSQPSHRELSKAQIISQNIENEDQVKKIWVNADSAYIRLVTHNSMKTQRTALRFSWSPPYEPTDEVEDLPEQKVSDQIKNAAILVCVYGYQCQSFHTAMEDRFKDEIVHMANNYLFVNEPNGDNQLISSKSVLLFDAENGLGQKKDQNEIYCQMSVAITSPYTDQWPLISHRTLHWIFFGKADRMTMHSFNDIKVTDCSHDSISLLKMILPIIVILVVSTSLLLAAWRYQYKNWTHSQRAENAKYTNPPVSDPSEDVLYSKDNPIFIDDEGNFGHNKAKVSNVHKSNDEPDSRPPIEHKKLTKQLSHGSSVSSKRLSSVKESPEFVKNLFGMTPSTSRQQNEYVFDNEFADNGWTDNTRVTPFKAESYSKSSADKLSPQPITGVNGTQHESLRKVFPQKSALRPTLSQRTVASDVEVGSPETNPFRRSSKVQFELPKPSIQVHYSSSDDLTD